MRWTIGDVSDAGWECLSESVRVVPKVYPEFDYVICYNSLSEDKIDFLKSFNIDLYEQKIEEIGIPYEFSKDGDERVTNHFWKLCPLRLRPESHEIWIDNDLILWNRIEEIDEFLESDIPIVSQKWSRELYGIFDSQVDEGNNICAGFFGLPPHYPFQEKVNFLCEGKTLSGYDEQGMVATIITNNKKGWLGIDPSNLNQLGWWGKYYTLPLGGHFIRLNTGTNLGWEYYKMMTHPDPKIKNNKSWEYRDYHVMNRGSITERAKFFFP